MDWLHPALRAGLGAGLVLFSLQAQAGETVLDRITGEPSLSTFAKAVEMSGLAPSLTGPGPVTVFAPNNDAFDTLPEGELAALLQPAAQAKLKQLVGRHIVATRIAIDPNVETNRDVVTLSGDELTLIVNSEFQALDTAQIVPGAMPGVNGVVYVVDEVIDAEPAFDEEDENQE